MASPTLFSSTTPTTSSPKPLPPIKSKFSLPIISSSSPSTSTSTTRRRDFLKLTTGILTPALFLQITPATTPPPALAASDEEYVSETKEVIDKVKKTLTMEKTDPNVATAVTELRETSNAWVAKYRKEKALLGRTSFRDIYSALNAVSGHYISFGPTAPIPAKRKTRILEEMDTAEKALLRGR